MYVTYWVTKHINLFRVFLAFFALLNYNFMCKLLLKEGENEQS